MFMAYFFSIWTFWDSFKLYTILWHYAFVWVQLFSCKHITFVSCFCHLFYINLKLSWLFVMFLSVVFQHKNVTLVLWVSSTVNPNLNLKNIFFVLLPSSPINCTNGVRNSKKLQFSLLFLFRTTSHINYFLSPFLIKRL